MESAHSLGFSIESTTTTTLASSLNPAHYGQSVTLTAKVVGKFGGTPTGKVEFKYGSATLATVSLSGGAASFSTKTLPAGTDSLTAVYAGDATDLTSTSAGTAEKVIPATTTTGVVSSANPQTHGKAVTFTATITPQFGGAVAGTVTFKDGSKTLGTGSVSGTDKATYTTSTLAKGTHSITAVYGGNSNNYGSTSKALSEVIH